MGHSNITHRTNPHKNKAKYIFSEHTAHHMYTHTASPPNNKRKHTHILSLCDPSPEKQNQKYSEYIEARGMFAKQSTTPSFTR